MAQVADLTDSLDHARAVSSTADEALQQMVADLTSTRAMLAESQREVAAVQRQAREAQQRHSSDLKAVERTVLQAREGSRQERCAAAPAEHDWSISLSLQS